MLVSTPVSLIARAFVLVVALTAPAVAVSAQSNRANQTQLRWYDAYNQGVRAVQNRDWAAAELLLLQAQASGTKPGPRVYAYGDSYLRFFPDYYLGIVYLNTGREREAETAFGRVRSQNLIGAKDPEYAALQRQSGEATFNRAMKEAVELNAKGDFTAARNRAEEARLTNVDNGKATKLLQDITVQMAKATTSAPPPPVTANPAPVQPPYTQNPSTIAGGQPPITVGNMPNASLPNQGVIQPPSTAVRNPQTPQNQTFKRQPPVLPPSTATLRNGLLAYFSGDYRSAIPLLTSAADQPGASPRAELFLACAKVGLALTGGGDAALLREARTAFQSANLQGTLSAADRRLISPRVLQQLEAQ
jgi:hypothetical protein